LTGRGNPYKVNFFVQVWALVNRQFALTKADLATFAIRIGSNVLNATLVGSICRLSPPHALSTKLTPAVASVYKPPDNAAGSFATAGAIFFAIL
jgi:ATP-binding cassette subfamily G (WHITE) protein 2 (SNQ2)